MSTGELLSFPRQTSRFGCMKSKSIIHSLLKCANSYARPESLLIMV
jgi:hypothetical protein